MSTRPTLPGEHQSTISVWVLSLGEPRKALLHKHKKFGVWLQPGGHVEPLEDPWRAAVREVLEETGIDISAQASVTQPDPGTWDLPQPHFLQVQTIPAYGSDPEHFHVDTQFVVTIPEQAVTPQAGEAPEVGWFSLAELAELPLFENTKVRLSALLGQSSTREAA